MAHHEVPPGLWEPVLRRGGGRCRGQGHRGCGGPQAVLHHHGPQGERHEGGLHRPRPEGALPGLRELLTGDYVSQKALG